MLRSGIGPCLGSPHLRQGHSAASPCHNLWIHPLNGLLPKSPSFTKKTFCKARESLGMRRTYQYAAVTKDEAQRRPSALLRAVSMSNGRWTFYEAVKARFRQLNTDTPLHVQTRYQKFSPLPASQGLTLPSRSAEPFGLSSGSKTHVEACSPSMGIPTSPAHYAHGQRRSPETQDTSGLNLLKNTALRGRKESL